MHLPSLQSASMTHFCMSGDVSIAPDAVIAAGSVLKADGGCAIVIGAGVCLGLGSVLHAHGGTITIEAGASVGAGTVVVGQCRIGAQACIGASTTIYNVSVAPGQLVPAASLLGNMGRPVEAATSAKSARATANTAATAAASNGSVGQTTDKRNSDEASPPKADRMEPEPSPWDEVDPETPAASTSSPHSASAQTSARHKPARNKTVVYGRAQFEQMRGAMSSRREDI